MSKQPKQHNQRKRRARKPPMERLIGLSEAGLIPPQPVMYDGKPLATRKSPWPADPASPI